MASRKEEQLDDPWSEFLEQNPNVDFISLMQLVSSIDELWREFLVQDPNVDFISLMQLVFHMEDVGKLHDLIWQKIYDQNPKLWEPARS